LRLAVFKRLFPGLLNMPREKWLALPPIAILTFAYVTSILGWLLEPKL
jgi:hypothetical protein